MPQQQVATPHSKQQAPNHKQQATSNKCNSYNQQQSSSRRSSKWCSGLEQAAAASSNIQQPATAGSSSSKQKRNKQQPINSSKQHPTATPNCHKFLLSLSLSLNLPIQLKGRVHQRPHLGKTAQCALPTRSIAEASIKRLRRRRLADPFLGLSARPPSQISSVLQLR
jgi:hypothetical protein